MTMPSQPFNESYTGARLDILRHVTGKALRILDVGCATGANGRYLLAHGHGREVVGIELSPDMAEVARAAYGKVIAGSLDDAEVLRRLSEEARFDCAILGDVLEHTVQPDRVLQCVVAQVKDDGQVIVSVPNMQHLDVFLHLFVQGDWPSNDRGIFDRTHIQMFTRKRLLRVLEAAGLETVSLHRNFRARDRLGSRFSSYPFSWVFRRVFKDLFTFQYIAVTRKRASVRSDDKAHR
jgi:2-polyprenyl-3-methyl-5-hydroxy-6-metoxy-1,4-benzoquinol methylase